MIKNNHNNYIRHHAQYLDRRISLISDICSRENLGKSSTDNLVLSLLRKAPLPVGLPDDLSPILEEIKIISDGWDVLSDGDLIGYFYQKLESANSKKIKGQFFTPTPVVDYLILNTIHDDIDLDTYRILDPSCGSGLFLISAYRRLIEIYLNRGIREKQLIR